MATRTFTSASFANMANSLVKEQPTPVFVTNTPSANIRYSEPMNIVALHYENKMIRAVGADGNVRVCKIDRLPSIEYARELWKMLVQVQRTGQVISFMAAGGFSPNKWFYDVAAE